MAADRETLSKAEHLKLYLFSSSFAVNLILEIIIIANMLSIQYFFHTTPMIIRIDFLSNSGNTLLWVGSLYVIYIAKEVAKEIARFRQVHRFLNLALIGSFLLLFSIFLTITSASAAPAAKQFLDQLLSLALVVGYAVSFFGSSLALFTILSQNKGMLKLFLIYLLSLLIVIEIWALIHWMVYPFDVVSFLGFAWRGAFIELQLFYLSYPLIFWLFLAFLFSWILVPLIRHVKGKIKLKQRIGIKASLFDLQSRNTASDEGAGEKSFYYKDPTAQRFTIRRLIPVMVLLVSLLLGVFVAYYPYLSSKPGLVGTDSLGYYYTLIAIDDKDFFGAVRLAVEINPARVLYHLSLYFFKGLTQLSAKTVIELMPIFTILANALAVFWFVKIGEKKTVVASAASVFSIFSFTTTVAMHAGILANWLAAALGFIMFGLVLRLKEKMSLKLFFAAVLVAASVFLVHYWSGVFFLLVLGCYMFVILSGRRRDHTKLVVALILLVSVILLALLSSRLVSYLVSYGFTENMGSTNFFVLFWKKLPILIDSWFFGALANPVIIALAFIGIVRCFCQQTDLSRLLISWVVVGSLLSVFSSLLGKNMNEWLIWRTIYLIPFQIPATLGLFFLIEKLGSIRENECSIQRDEGAVQRVKSSNSFQGNENFKVVFTLVIDYIVCAFLLALDFPIFGALIFFNYLVLTLIVHFKLRKRDNSSIVIFLFVMFVILLLFNYALRSLAPLTVHRLQPS